MGLSPVLNYVFCTWHEIRVRLRSFACGDPVFPAPPFGDAVPSPPRSFDTLAGNRLPTCGSVLLTCEPPGHKHGARCSHVGIMCPRSRRWQNHNSDDNDKDETITTNIYSVAALSRAHRQELLLACSHRMFLTILLVSSLHR